MKRPSRQYFVIFITLITLTGLFCGYFFAYVPHKEQQIDERTFRVLTNLNKNAANKAENYIKNAKVSAENAINEIQILQNVNAANKAENQFKKVKISSENSINETQIPPMDKFPIQDPGNYHPIDLQKFVDRVRIKKYNQGIRFIDVGLERAVSSNQTKPAGTTTSQVHGNIGQFVLRRLNGSSELTFTDTLTKIHHQKELSKELEVAKKYFKYTFSFEIKDFFESLQRKDVFENFFVINEEGIIYQSFPGLKLYDIDSTLEHFHGLETSTLRDAEIGGVPYKVFLQPTKIHSHNWILGGLVTREKYNSHKLSVSAHLIFFISVFLLLLVLSLPFLKLKIMGQNERLGSTDIVLSVASLILGTMLITVLFLFSYSHFQEKDNVWDQEHNLSEFSSNISGNLNEELKRISEEVESNDDLINKLSIKLKRLTDVQSDPRIDVVRSVNRNLIKMETIAALENFCQNKVYGQDIAGYKFHAQQTLQNTQRSNRTYSTYDQLIWMDKNGDQKFKWATSKRITPHINVKSRKYFDETKNDRGWLIPGIDRKLYLQSIASWTTGKKMAEIAFNSGKVDFIPKPVVTAMTSELYSIIDPVVPAGYGFCIVDQLGNVQFHSNKDRNLQENFLEECSGGSDLKEAIHARKRSSFSAKYHGKEHVVHIEPLWSTPLFLITFSDQYGIDAARTLTMSYTLIMAFFVCLLYFIQLAVITITQVSPSRLNSKIFKFEWLRPKRNHTFRYQVGLLWVLLLILNFVVGLCVLESRFTVIQLILMLPFYLVPSLYFLLNKEGIKESNGKKFQIVLFSISPLIIAISLLLVFTISKTNMVTFGFWLFQMLPMILLFIASGYALDRNGIMLKLIKQMTSLSIHDKIDGLLSRLSSQGKEDVKLPPAPHYAYTFFMLTWLLSVAVLPTTYFFKVAFDQETELIIKNRQIEYANALDMRDIRVMKMHEPSLDPESFKERLELTSDIYILPGDSLEWSSSEAIANASNTGKLFKTHYNSIRASYSDNIGLMNGLVWDNSAHSTREWTHLESGGIIFKSSNGSIERIIKSDISQLPWFQLTGPAVGQKILMLLTFAFLFILVRFLMRHVFLLDQLHFKPTGWEETQSMLSPYYSGNSDDSTLRNILLIGEPFSGKSELIAPFISEHKNSETTVVDFSETLNMNDDDCQTQHGRAINSKSSHAILLRFDHRNNDLSSNLRKLELLEALVAKNKHIILLSTLDLFHLFSKYNTDDYEQKSIHSRWRTVLGSFSKFFIPLKPLETEDQHEGSSALSAAKRLIDNECMHGEYLHSLRKQLYDYADNLNDIRPEDVILHIQSVAQSYYHVLWSSCSDREKFLLYDLAEDGFINNKNSYAIQHMLKRGLLINHQNQHIRIMNKSFENFILSMVKRDDALRVELQDANHGTWSMFRTPLILVVLAIAAFIFISEQTTFNTIISFIGTISAALLGGFRLFGTLGAIGTKFSAKPVEA